jgi:hypothetical protein
MLRSPLAFLALLAVSVPPPHASAQGGGAPSEGLTLFHPVLSTTTYLIDISGSIVHTWPGTFRAGSSVYLLEDQSLLRATRGQPGPSGGPAGIELVAWDGTLLWRYLDPSPIVQRHHDIEILPNRNVLTIAYQIMTAADAIQAGRNPATIAGSSWTPDSILEIQTTGPASGDVVWEWHVMDHVIQDFDPTKDNFGVIADHPEMIDINFPPTLVTGGDWNHTNAIDYNAELDQIIISPRNQSELWVIDHSTTTEEAAGHTGGSSGYGGDLLYRWGNPQAYGAGTVADQRLFGQHNTQWIDEGAPGASNILVFNNGLDRPAGPFSSVEEIVPPVDAQGNYTLMPGAAYGPASPTWTYQAPNPTDFYSHIISGAQRLPNGNTLIDSGTQEWFFEVTPTGDIVWEYFPSIPGLTHSRCFRAERYQLCLPPTSTCQTSPNSMGAGATMGWSGSSSHSSNDLVISVSGAAASQPGVFYFGDQAVQLPFGDGMRCVGGTVHRLPVQLTDPGGDAAFEVDFEDASAPTAIMEVGDTWHFQFWYRDPAFGGSGFNLSDALEITVCN